MNYNGCDVKLNNNGIMIRPKFGFYRSLEDPNLKDESVKIADICVGQNDACFYDANGNKYNPSDRPNLKGEEEEQ